jgi:GNAT superfamily N-acetyltransferase
MGITVRKVEKSDAKAIQVLSDQLGYPATLTEITTRLEDICGNDHHLVYVAESPGNGIIGWIHVLPRPLLVVQQTAEIGGLVVDEEHRGKGVGRLLMQAAEQWIYSQGYTEVVVRSNAVREGAHQFYPSVGYELKKTQQVYKKSLDSLS